MRILRTLQMIILVAISMIGNNTFAQEDLNVLMRERNEYYFKLTIEQASDIQAISKLCSIDDVDGNTVVCYANSQQYTVLLQQGYHPTLMAPPSMHEEPVMWNGSNRSTYEWDSYPTYDAYASMMQAFATEHPDRCTYIEQGTLPSGRKVMGIRINNGQPDGKPRFLYTSTIHGDEVTGMMLMLHLIDELSTSTDTRIMNIINNLDLFIFPCTNPDGTYHGGNNSVYGATRYNANGVDLNRHYPDFVDGPHPDGASYYENEAIWMMNMAEEYLFTMGANYHGGAEVLNYPWDNYTQPTADDAWWELVCHEYANQVHQINANYMTDYNDGIVRGCLWYMIGGGRQDYMNYYQQCREVTIECSNSKTPNAAELPKFWNYNHNSMIAYMEQCLNGLHGLVYDVDTHEPIVGATITILDHDHHGSFVTSHNVGDFHRPIKGGNYTLQITKEGYCPQFIDVTIDDNQRLDIDTVFLEPGNCLLPLFTASSTEIALGQSINFTDESFGDIVSWNWTFDGATPSSSTDQNPTDITYSENGFYNVTLTITDAEGNSETLTKTEYIHVLSGYNMHNGTVQTCEALFYDSGGPDENYGNSLNYVMTFLPEGNGNKISVTFTSFELENYWDYLYIYDGTSTSATQIGRYTGTSNPGMVTATNVAGALTFKFTSDSNTTKSGWAANITCSCTINASADPEEGGQVLGDGTYNYGETCTLTAVPYDGFFFISWTENGEVVSTEANYSFDVTANRTLVANFATSITQTDELAEGWNWWSTYLQGEGSDLLDQLKQTLGSNGLRIVSQSNGYTFYVPQQNVWYGSLNTIKPGEMYKIQTSSACTININGIPALPNENPISLNPGFTWIGFVGTQELEINEALIHLTPANSDMIKNGSQYAIYFVGQGWTGNLTSLKPGKGYNYNSKATVVKSFVFPTTSK